MSQAELAAFDPVASLLGDLDTLTTLAQSTPRAPGGALVPGETRPAAILLVDIVGFTPLAQLLGAEALSHLVDRCFRIFELAVQAHGGYCDKLIGDAGLYVFAGHVSYEPPCQGALRSALEIQRRVGQVNQSLGEIGLSLSVRCGVSFGEVTRQRIGGAEQQFTVMGDAVNLAQRLEGNALPGTVCTVAAVLDETGDMFAYEARGSFELKGIGPRELFTVTAERTLPVQLRGRGQISPLIGRDALLNEAAGVVREWLARDPVAAASSRRKSDDEPGGTDVAATNGCLLTLRGPTAVGKSRLAWEVTRRLAADFPLAIATAHCTPHGGLLGFAAELCKVAGLTADNVAERWAELCALNSEVDHAAHLPLLAYVLGSSSVDTAAIRQGDSAAFSAACKSALSAFIELAAREGKLPLLVIEDIQWLGELEDVLAHLLNEVHLPVPLVVIATARPAVGDEFLYRLIDVCHSGGDSKDLVAPSVPGAEPSSDQREPSGASPMLKTNRLRLIDVTALTLEQGRDLLTALLPGATLPDALEAELHEKSLGLPYYYEEAARLLLRTGVVVPSSDQREPPRDSEVSIPVTYIVVGTLDTLPIPDDLRTLILGRLDTLPPQLRELAQHASVLGRSFELDMLLKLEQHVGGMSADEVHTALAALHDERILHADLGGATENKPVAAAVPGGEPSNERSEPPHVMPAESPRYFFTHVLTRDAAYTSLLSVNKRRLHGAAGDIASQQHVPGTAAEWDLLPRLYEHYAAAQRWDAACRLACDTLMLRARSHRLDLCEEWRAKAEKCLGLVGNNGDLEAHFSWALGVVALIRKDYQQCRSLLESALLGSQAAGANQLRVNIIIDLALVLRELHDYALAEGLLIEARDLTERNRLTSLEEIVLDSLGAIYRKQGRLKESIEVLERAASKLRASDNYNLLCTLLIRLGNNYLDSNELDQAYAVFTEAQAYVSKQFDPTLEIMLVTNLGCYFGLKGETEESLSQLTYGLRRCRQIGWREGEAHNHLNIGDIYLETDRAAKAHEHLSEAVALFLDTEDYGGLAVAYGTLADALITLKQYEEASAALQQADSCFQRTGDQFCRGLIQISWARYHGALGNVDHAALAISRARALGRHTSTGSQTFLEHQIAKLEQDWLTTPNL